MLTSSIRGTSGPCSRDVETGGCAFQVALQIGSCDAPRLSPATAVHLHLLCIHHTARP